MDGDDELEGIFEGLEVDDENLDDAVQELALDEKLLSGDDLDDKAGGLGPDSPPLMGGQEPIFAQPVNRATMTCLRGPCIHFWTTLARYVAVGKDDIYIKILYQCNLHTEETNLGGQNVYHCGQWWPTHLAWVPQSARAILRPKLFRLYREWLELIGYDFSWKTWSDDVFMSDRKDQRGDSGPGGSRFLRKEDSLRGHGSLVGLVRHWFKKKKPVEDSEVPDVEVAAPEEDFFVPKPDKLVQEPEPEVEPEVEPELGPEPEPEVDDLHAEPRLDEPDPEPDPEEESD
ncbi:MAG: hypothetical protein JRD89_19755 [Deltaproteobacteria bacterium]|nr:hypothetical protein [Deltaproteobacteria bacterium]